MTAALNLEVAERTEIHPTTGEPVRVTEYRRGILVSTRKTFDDMRTFFEDVGSETPRQIFESNCEDLRAFLERKGLPSDRQPHWVRYNDGEWQEGIAPPGLPKPGERICCSLWIKRLEELTEPLLPERLAGQLLWMMTDMLKRPGIDEHLWHIERYANLLFMFRMAGAFNQLADLGAKGRRARAAGPKAKRAKGLQVAAIVAEYANEYWRDQPGHRGIASTTAEAIRSNVNGRLKSDGLLPKLSEGLGSKTIADYIRKNKWA